jgi:hypothetical protein
VLATALIVAVAAAQPVWRTREAVPVRTDAAAWVVVDTSRSMLAARSPGAEDRLARARRAALRVREALRGVPVGLASLTDRALPHLFPSPDAEAFAGALARAIRPGHPAPTGLGDTGTDLTALAALPTANFFAPAAVRRVAVVLTDGESRQVDAGTLSAAFRALPRIALVLVRVGASGERVHDESGLPEPGYAPGPDPGATAAGVAALAAGRVFSEDEVGEAAAAAAAAAGRSGPTAEAVRGERRRALAPWVLAAAALPLAFLVRRRNLDR